MMIPPPANLTRRRTSSYDPTPGSSWTNEYELRLQERGAPTVRFQGDITFVSN